MQLSLLNTLKKYVTDTALNKAAMFLNENDGQIRKAADIIMPTVLSGIVQLGATQQGMQTLQGLFDQHHFLSHLSQNASPLFGGGSATQGLTSLGHNLLNTNIFGDKFGKIVGQIAQLTNLKNGSVAALMAMITPFAMGICQAKIAEGQRNGVVGAAFLRTQETSLISALPLSIVQLLGWSGKARSPNAADAANVANHASWAWLLLGMVGIGGLYYLKNQSVTPKPPTIEALPIELPKTDTTTKIVTSTARDTAQVKVIALSDSVKIEAKAGSFLDSLYQELANKASSVGKHLNFDNVNFATNSAVVPKDYQTKLDDITKILKAFPKVALLIEGHTDNVGNAAKNLKLSDARAAAVRAYLVSHGIEAARLATKGFGATKPTADNTTEQGRAKNRRIEAVITNE